MHEFRRKYSQTPFGTIIVINEIKLTCFFVLSNLRLRGFTTGRFGSLRYELLESHKTTTFHWLLHTRFCDLVRWTVIIGAMQKTAFG